MIDKSERPKACRGSGIEWAAVRRVLVVRLRSIGDTVLATPSLIALKRFLPDAQVDILLEDWVVPLLDGFEDVNVISVSAGYLGRFAAARRIRRNTYDVVFNLHGGTTSTLLTRATGASHRIGYSHYSYSNLYTDLLSSSADFWGRAHTHSAEQQLALLGFAGVLLDERPRSSLTVTDQARDAIEAKLKTAGVADKQFALLHPTAAFATKVWPVKNFGRVVEYLASNDLHTIAIAAKNESEVLRELTDLTDGRLTCFDDLSLPEITALASRASLFVGNDSGIAHIAAAVNTPSVVIFGSSNIHHWRPWTDASNEVVYHPLACQPCAGYTCKVYGEPQCIQSVTADSVIEAIQSVFQEKRKADVMPAYSSLQT